ncbi:MAG: gamma-glutamyl-gamma-aminobutyrate hydrolase family protein [Candidatus Rifleibacteriota bacterium]
MKKNLLTLLIALFWASLAYASERPIVGITPSYDSEQLNLHYDYIEAVLENGGTPVVLAPTTDEEVIRRYVEMLDAAVFSGGMDIYPELYGQKAHSTTKVMDPLRSAFEQKFITAFLQSGKPVLGICLGMQFSNVVQGGTMYQDIPSLIGERVRHRNGERYTNFHAVGIARGSRLEKILGKTSARVISRHHQAVDRLGKNLAVSARSSDGVIEALERTDGPFGIFVQWHPESLKNADPEHRNRLLKALIEAAAAR